MMLGYIVKKEFTLIFRDIHALLVLFVMPTLFILIMSLALHDSYSQKMEVKFQVALLENGEEQPLAYTMLMQKLRQSGTFHFQSVKSESSLKELLYQKGYDFAVAFPADFKQRLQNDRESFRARFFARSDVSPRQMALLKGLYSTNVSKVLLEQVLGSLGVSAAENDIGDRIESRYVYKQNDKGAKPTSVQQSVPAWLVFSMFFILIPISNTFINEKRLGTIERIRSIDVSLWPILFGKFLPYFVINQIQVVLMIAVGYFLVPLLGGDRLQIAGNPLHIALMAAAVSFASICFALLIANISKTTEEATSIGGVSNIILAALGGIMVPKFVMPEFMQEVTEYSPMAWALQGFLELFTRAGGLSDIAADAGKLLLFGIISLLLSFYILQKGSR